jgi:hypothetical protein
MTDAIGRNPQEDRNLAGDPSEADPGAYVGNQPERQAETIPGGVLPDDERVAAHSTYREPGHDDSDEPPDRREAGQSR